MHCDESGREDYHDCTECLHSKFDTTPRPNDRPGYRFCASSCPTLWECDVGDPECPAKPPMVYELYAYYFAYSQPDSSDQWANSVTDEEHRKATLHVTHHTGSQIATDRGIYFSLHPAWVELESHFVLNHSFSVWMWTFHQSICGEHVMFAKDRNPERHVRFYTDDAKIAVDMAKEDDHTVFDTVRTGNNNGLMMSWAFLGFSVQMRFQKDSDIKIYKDEGIAVEGTMEGIFMDDFAAPYQAHIGIERNAVNTCTTPGFYGFIYEFHLW